MTDLRGPEKDSRQEPDEYEAQLNWLRTIILQADASLEAGLARELDVPALMARVRDRVD